MGGKPWRTNPLNLDLIAGPESPFETRLAFLEEGPDPLGTVLDVSPEGGTGLLPARKGQSGLGDDAPDLLPLRVGDAPEWGTDVGLVDPA